MRETTRKIAFFTITEYEKEQEWLSKWHRRGWKLTKATLPCFYKFERCEPDEVVRLGLDKNFFAITPDN